MRGLLRFAADGFCRIGYGTVQVGFVRLGEMVFRLALKLSPHHTVALRWLAWSVNANGAPSEAISYYKELVTLDPSFVEGHVELGFALASTGRCPNAIEQFQMALERSPGHAGAGMGLAASLIEINHAAEAIPVCERLVNDNPVDAEAWGWLGRARSETGQWDDALTAYETAHALGVDAAVTAEHAGVLMELDRYSEAETLLRTALRTHRTDIKLRVQLACVFAEYRRYADAENLLRDILQDHPVDAEARRALAAVCASSGRASEALAIAERLVQDCPDDSEAYAVLGWVASKSGRADDALRAYDRALLMRPGRLPFLAGRATALKQLARHSEAEDVVKMIQVRDSSFFDRNSDWPDLKTFSKSGDS